MEPCVIESRIVLFKRRGMGVSKSLSCLGICVTLDQLSDLLEVSAREGLIEDTLDCLEGA